MNTQNSSKMSENINGTNGLGLIDLDGIEDDIERHLEPMPIMNTVLGANSELVFSEAN